MIELFLQIAPWLLGAAALGGVGGWWLHRLSRSAREDALLAALAAQGEVLARLGVDVRAQTTRLLAVEDGLSGVRDLVEDAATAAAEADDDDDTFAKTIREPRPTGAVVDAMLLGDSANEASIPAMTLVEELTLLTPPPRPDKPMSSAQRAWEARRAKTQEREKSGPDAEAKPPPTRAAQRKSTARLAALDPDDVPGAMLEIVAAERAAEPRADDPGERSDTVEVEAIPAANEA